MCVCACDDFKGALYCYYWLIAEFYNRLTLTKFVNYCHAISFNLCFVSLLANNLFSGSGSRRRMSYEDGQLVCNRGGAGSRRVWRLALSESMSACRSFSFNCIAIKNAVGIEILDAIVPLLLLAKQSIYNMWKRFDKTSYFNYKCWFCTATKNDKVCF